METDAEPEKKAAEPEKVEGEKKGQNQEGENEREGMFLPPK